MINTQVWHSMISSVLENSKLTISAMTELTKMLGNFFIALNYVINAVIISLHDYAGFCELNQSAEFNLLKIEMCL